MYKGQLELPAGYRATAPADCHLVEPYAEYTAKSRIEKGVMTTSRELVVKKNEVELNEWENFRNFGRAVNDNEYAFIQLKRGAGGNVTADAIDIVRPDSAGGETETETQNADQMFRDAIGAAQRRDPMRAEGLLRKVIKKDPKYKGAHLGLGSVLLAQNKPDEALKEYQLEEEVSPNDVRAFQGAAFVAKRMGNTELEIDEYRKLLKVDPTNQTSASALAVLLTRKEKYSEAVEVLEPIVKSAPDNVNLQYELGDAYLRNKQIEQGVPHIKIAMSLNDHDTDMLEDVALQLAEAKSNLDLAQQCGEKAVSELDDEAQRVESSDEAALDATWNYLFFWDTLGWVYFQQGDLERAEVFVRASWLLSEGAEVADHLGQIYEREGKKEQAARTYELALALPPSGPGPNLEPERADEFVTRYEKLTGKKPAEVHRLPNGEWSQTPAERLRDSRGVEMENEGELSGSAQFTLSLKPGKASVSFLSGDHELEPLSEKLSAAKFPLEFPPDSRAILRVRLDVNCHPSKPCFASLIPPEPPQFRAGHNAN